MHVPDQADESVVYCLVGLYFSIFRLQYKQLTVYQPYEIFRTVEFLGVEVKMDDRILFPSLFEFRDSQSFEQLFLSLEIRFKSADQQTFSEPARAAQEIITASRDKSVYQRSLVDIEVSSVTELLEILYSYRIKLSHNH